MKEQMLLTSNGNLLRHCDLGWYFSKPTGEFLREVTWDEAEYLETKCLKIEAQGAPEHPSFFPFWEFITSVRTFADYRGFKGETSIIGGDYVFYEDVDWYVALTPDGTYQFRYVKTYSTSSNIGYDNLKGEFQIVRDLNLTNAPRVYATQNGGEAMLEQISQIGQLHELWNTICETLSFLGEKTESQISFSKKKEIFVALKELGITKIPRRVRRRGSPKNSRR